ncbi:hypothetical protein [Caniella muris]|uniref:hypothetical protein n=1 Tax=Caniella muris TaxID=2941502 RepID=UPI00204027D2|nr:hypothetical protein [Caniella muris]
MDIPIREIISKGSGWSDHTEVENARFLLLYVAKFDDGLKAHSERVAAAVERAWGPADTGPISAALLHDLVEDSEVTLDDISLGFSPALAASVDALTRREGEGYTAYIDRVAKDPVASLVKTADLQDHLDPRFEGTLPSESYRRRCARALARLTAADVLLSQTLHKAGADGLVDTDAGCGCAIGDLFPCRCPNLTGCVAAVRREGPEGPSFVPLTQDNDP